MSKATRPMRVDPVSVQLGAALGVPSFAATSTNPFGLASVGSDAAPALADIDGDGGRSSPNFADIEVGFF